MWVPGIAFYLHRHKWHNLKRCSPPQAQIALPHVLQLTHLAHNQLVHYHNQLVHYHDKLVHDQEWGCPLLMEWYKAKGDLHLPGMSVHPQTLHSSAAPISLLQCPFSINWHWGKGHVLWHCHDSKHPRLFVTHLHLSSLLQSLWRTRVYQGKVSPQCTIEEELCWCSRCCGMWGVTVRGQETWSVHL